MREEDDPFAGFRDRNDLTLGRSLCAMVAARYPALRRSFISSMMEEASHLPLEPDPAMVGAGGGGGEEDENFSGAESLGDGKAKEM